MKKQITLFATLLTLGLASTGFATTTYQFNATGQGGLTGFADHLSTLGAAQNGMKWGIIIDTAGNGFGTAVLDGTGLATGGGNYTETSFFSGSYVTGGTFLTGTNATDDYFYVPTSVPSTLARTAQGSDPGGNGGVLSLTGAPNVSDAAVAGLTTGDKFAIVWFETSPANGTYYGLYSPSAFTVPGSGATADYFTPFNSATAEPIKPANLTFGVGPAPEPSRALLLGFGALGLLVRRRRA